MRLAPVRAIAWELWHRGKWWFMIAVITNVLILRGTMIIGPDPQIQLYALMRIFPLIVLAEMMMYIAMIAQAQGGYLLTIPPRYYRFPISTGALVGLHIGIGAVMVSLMHLAMCFITFVITGAIVPVLGPVLFIILALVSYQAMLLVLSGRTGLIVVAGFLLASGLINWLFHASRSGVEDAWPTLTRFHAIWLLIAIALSCVISFFGAARERRGDAGASIGLRERWDGVMLSMRTRRIGFDSPQAAQFWFERRSKGGPTLAIMMLPILTCIAMIFSHANARDFLEAGFGMSMFCLMGGAVPIGLLLGQSVKGKTLTIDLFKATRPLTDRQIAWTILRSAAIEIATGWFIFGLLMLVLSVFVANVDPGHFKQFWASYQFGAGWHFFALRILVGLVWGIVIHWILIGLGITFALTGRLYITVIFFMALFGSFFGMLYFAHRQEGPFIIWTMLIALLIGAQWILIQGARRDYIPFWVSMIPLGLVAIIALMGGPKNVPDVYSMVTIGSFMLLLPFASAPLALAWNRRR